MLVFVLSAKWPLCAVTPWTWMLIDTIDQLSTPFFVLYTGELGRTSAVNRVVRPRGVLQKCGKFSSTDLWSIIYSTEIITSLCGYGFRGLNDVFGQHYCVIGVLAERSVHNLNYFVGIKYFGNISASYHHFSIRCEMISHFKNEVYLL